MTFEVSKTSTLEKTLKKFRYSPIGSAMIPMESCFSLPVPFERGGEWLLTVLIYSIKKSKSQPGFEILAPSGSVTLRSADGKLVRYEDFSAFPPLGKKTPKPGTSIGIFPHPTVAPLKPSDYRLRRSQLCAAIEELMESSAPPPLLNQLWPLMFEPSLAPYYWTIAPKFIRNLMEVSSSPTSNTIE